MNLRHITRFTYTYTNFQGWRVAINRQGTTLARYFSDKQYGSEDVARDEAIRFRDMLLDELNRNPQNTREILDKYRIQAPKPYPAGLKPSNTRSEQEEGEQKVAACSVRSNQVMHSILRRICNRLKLDTASVLKLSLYMFALQYNEQTALADKLAETQPQLASSTLPAGYPDQPEETLRQLVAELETLAQRAGLPSFEEFSTGKRGRSTDPVTQPPTTDPPLMKAQIDSHNTRPPRPSPPQHQNRTRLTSLFSSSLAAGTHASATQQHHIDSHSGIERTELKPKRIAPGATLTNLPPPDIIC